MRFFSYDGFLATAIRYIFKLFVLNLCYGLCCIPLVTIGAATTALYTVFFDHQPKASMLGRFFRSFRSSFRPATKAWLLLMIPATVLLLDWYFLLFYQFAGKQLLTVLTVIISVVFLSVLAFVFPLLARYENTVKQTLKNALLLGTGKLFWGVLMSILTYYPVLLFFAELEVFVYVMLLWIPFGFCLSAFVNAKLAKRVFGKL